MSGQERTEEGQPFRVIYAPPPDTTHYCDIPQSAYDLHRRGMKPPEMGTVIECKQCLRRWVADYQSIGIWSPVHTEVHP